jgi:hypothetical protein
MAGADKRMTIATYLEHRRWVEVAAVVSTMFLVAATQTTTEVIDNLRQGLPSDWLAAAAKELTSGVAVLAMLPALVCYEEVESQAISYTTGVPAMIGAVMMVTGKWKKPGVWNMEQLDPDPFMEELNRRGLPWVEEIWDG